MAQGAPQNEALDVRVERLAGGLTLLGQQVSQSNANLTNSLAAMSADVRDMTKEIRGMAPHAADIASLRRLLEKFDADNATRDTEIARQGKQIEFWRGGLASIAVVGMIVITGGMTWANKEFTRIDSSRKEIREQIMGDLGALQRRTERLENLR